MPLFFVYLVYLGNFRNIYSLLSWVQWNFKEATNISNLKKFKLDL